jgi:CRP/FNR family transcriptional regulator, cyclic AMP receptor protein
MLSHLTLEQTLRSHAFLQGLGERHIARIASLASQISFDENEVIMLDRQESEYFYLLVSGSVIMELRSPVFSVLVMAIGPGQAFGWSALLRDQDTLFQVRARVRSSAIRIPGADLVRACREDPELGVEILLRTLQIAAGRMEATEARFAEICGVRIKSAARKTGT